MCVSFNNVTNIGIEIYSEFTYMLGFTEHPSPAAGALGRMEKISGCRSCGVHDS